MKAMEQIHHVDTDAAKFMRKGQAGNWRTELSGEQIRRMKEWEERQLVNTGFTFQYD